jgi:hypothetical protein
MRLRWWRRRDDIDIRSFLANVDRLAPPSQLTDAELEALRNSLRHERRQLTRVRRATSEL